MFIWYIQISMKRNQKQNGWGIVSEMVVNKNNRKNNFLVLSDGPTNGYIIKFNYYIITLLS